MNAAFTSYKENTAAGVGVTAAHNKPCGTTGTTFRRARPSTILRVGRVYHQGARSLRYF
jgi:hypothetical protein